MFSQHPLSVSPDTSSLSLDNWHATCLAPHKICFFYNFYLYEGNFYTHAQIWLKFWSWYKRHSPFKRLSKAMVPVNSALCREKVDAWKPAAFCWPCGLYQVHGLSHVTTYVWSGPRRVSCPVTRVGESCNNYTWPKVYMTTILNVSKSLKQQTSKLQT